VAFGPIGDPGRHPQRNIVLLGFHCAGKTCVGRALARRMRRPFIDWDAEVARRTPGSWRALWPASAEQRYDREHAEARLVDDLGYRREAIIAMGAEAAASEDYMRELRDFALLVFLDTPWPALRQRALGSGCMGVWDAAGEELAQERYESLEPHYADCDLRLYNAELSVERAASLILHCFYA
jgi:shikimate kinase